ncbi:MAG: diaminopimelate epimerase [Desulfuromonadaceae bacterium]|nr:diaminopimelate epimerase [Desulfuromonadaceae bacterium]
MQFVKMHGAGNDYVYVDTSIAQVDNPSDLAIEVSSRHFGIGSDGLILIMPSQVADARMRMFNADGSEAQMCGNGIRCVAKYLYDRQRVSDTTIRIETGAGIRSIQVVPGADGKVEKARVDMGVPELQRGNIPMQGDPAAQALNVELEVGGETFEVCCVSMGNPHCVVFVTDVATFPVEIWGPLIETHQSFPERTNVEFVEVLSRTAVKQRTWERGAGETLACGTGASAVVVAAYLTERTERSIVNHLRGGDLQMEYTPCGSVHMTGGATEVFRGEYIPLELRGEC